MRFGRFRRFFLFLDKLRKITVFLFLAPRYSGFILVFHICIKNWGAKVVKVIENERSDLKNLYTTKRLHPRISE